MMIVGLLLVLALVVALIVVSRAYWNLRDFVLVRRRIAITRLYLASATDGVRMAKSYSDRRYYLGEYHDCARSLLSEADLIALKEIHLCVSELHTLLYLAFDEFGDSPYMAKTKATLESLEARILRYRDGSDAVPIWHGRSATRSALETGHSALMMRAVGSLDVEVAREYDALRERMLMLAINASPSDTEIGRYFSPFFLSQFCPFDTWDSEELILLRAEYKRLVDATSVAV